MRRVCWLQLEIKSLERVAQVVLSANEAVEFEIDKNVNFAYTSAVPYETSRFGHRGYMNVSATEDVRARALDFGCVGVWWSEYSILCYTPLENT